MLTSKFQEKKKNLLRLKAAKLYKQGLTYREVGKIVNMSHEWVAYTVRGILNKGVDKSV